MNAVYCVASFNPIEGSEALLWKNLNEVQKMNNEPWCELYVPTVQINNKYAPGDIGYMYTFIEKFKSEEDFNNHCEEGYIKKFFADNESIIKERNICLFRAFN